MKNNIKFFIALCIASMAFASCKKDMANTKMTDGVPSTVSLSPADIVLTAATAADTVQTISWTAADYGYSAAVKYTVEIAKAGTNFAGAAIVNAGSAKSIKYIGAVLNDLAIGFGISPNSTGTLDIRVKSSLSDSVFKYSSVAPLTVKTYQVDFPALLVKGGNAWVTPASRTNGFLLTSPNFDTQYEGYINLPNADGWGGDALKLVSTSSGIEYGWGGSSTTMAAGASGYLWFTPAPNYMKVTADVSALTVNFTPVQFNVTGDHNSWNTSANPMTYDPTSKKLTATVTFAAGNKFVFTCNGSYDNSYKVNNDGKLIFAGPPAWAGNNIPAPGAGTYTVTLDLSQGNGSYTYSIQ